jgi:pimeloyl-ACP methyl ester carboxylesterase
MTDPFPEVHPAIAVSSGARDDYPVVLLHGGNVARWMWEPQLTTLRHRTVITPDLPGFGERTEESWPGLPAAADDVAVRVEKLTGHRRFHVVGLSLGGVVAIHLAAQHPTVAASVLASGVALRPVRGAPRLAGLLQLALWEVPWFWRAQAIGFGLPADSRDQYVSHGLSVRRETARRMFHDVHAGQVPGAISAYHGPLLLVAGEREPRVVRRSLHAATLDVPQLEARIAPGMHHVWSVEDPGLFGAMILAWLEGRVEPRLRPVP